MSLRHHVNVLNSFVVSSVRAWRGTMVWRDVGAPAQLLELYDIEGNADCREVREILTELNLNAVVTPCPEGSRHLPSLKALLAEHDLALTLPVLVDKNAGDKKDGIVLVGREAVLSYLVAVYGRGKAPRVLPDRLYNGWNSVSGLTARMLRRKPGMRARPAHTAKLPLVLYSFESSPYSRPVRERLCELQLRYELRNVGKEQLSDFGPNGARWTLRKWSPVTGGRRERMIGLYGRAQMPYLEDPNTGAKLFESKAILAYVQDTYADKSIG